MSGDDGPTQFRRRNILLHLHLELLIHVPPSSELTVVIPRLEFYSIRSGPDGLPRITRRPERRGIEESWLVDSTGAEEAVVLRWARFHLEVLGASPVWHLLSKGH